MKRANKFKATVFAISVPLVGGFEGLRTVAYYDPVRIPTACFGETRGIKMGDSFTVAQCNEILEDRLAEFATELDKCLVADVSPKMYSSILSWTYNIGSGAACGSTLVWKANNGDLVGACNELPKWNKATLGKTKITLRGLTIRRTKERELCLAGVHNEALPASALSLPEMTWLQTILVKLKGAA